jgi:DNA-binding MarR family transcriptional regulator
VAAKPFLRSYLYGPAIAEAGDGSSRPPERAAIPGRRAPAHLARRFAQIINALMAEVLGPHGLTGQHWGVMVAIVREPGIDQRRVAERQGRDVNSTGRAIDELEALGIVRRLASMEDRRAYRLELTAKGKRMRAKLQEPVIAAQDRALACLEQAEKKTLLDLLTRVVETNREHARPGAGRRKPVRSNKALPPSQPA